MPGKNEIDELDYKKAVTLMDLIIIDQSHKLLDSSVVDIEDSSLFCENPEIELGPIRTQIFHINPDFLENPTEPRLIELKKDIEAYKGEYEKLCNQINKFVNDISESLKKLIEPSNNLKNEINKIIKEFENTVKNLCGPLISERKGLDTIDINKLSENQKDAFQEDKLSITYKINEFKKESENLNKKYYKYFYHINQAVQEICNNIKGIPPIIIELQDKIEEGMSKYEEILEEFTDSNNLNNFHKLLLKIKESLYLIIKEKNNVEKKIKDRINNLDIQFKKRKAKFNALKEESKKIIDNLILKSKSINENIKKVRENIHIEEVKLPEIKITELIKKKTIDSMDESVEIVKEVNNSFSKGIQKVEIKIKSKTSLDLLYIMDTTGSMEQYVKITKEKLNKIIDNIIKECNGIEINLGFIGYKDVIEHENKDYVDEDFTQDYIKVKNKINKIKVGGGDDTAEDVAWAFERAIEKGWSSNAKLAILVTDAPCHGIKFHEKDLIDNYPKGVSIRKDIEELVELMSKRNISLICIKLQNYTNKMYDIFKNIYKKNNINNNIIFDIISIDSPENLEKIVTNNAIQVYKTKRFDENK